MSFLALGYVEVACDPECSWFAALIVDAFMPGGDEVSALLFGLGKGVKGPVLFGHRGVPEDASPRICEEVEADDEYGKTHNDGPHGYTYATWSEIKAVEWSAYGVDLSQSGWNEIFELVNVIEKQGRFPPHLIRFVVWGQY